MNKRITVKQVGAGVRFNFVNGKMVWSRYDSA